MKIILKEEVDEFLKKDWKILEDRNNFLIFQSLNWNLKWLEKNKKEKDIKIFITYENDQPILIFPFCIVKKFGFKIIKWIGHDISDYLGPLVDSQYRDEKVKFNQIWNDIFKIVKSKCDLIYLEKQISHDIFFYNFLIKNLKCKKYDETYGVNFSNWAELKRAKNKTLQKFRWSKKKLSEIGELEFIPNIEAISEKKNLLKNIIDWKVEGKINSSFVKSFSNEFYIGFMNNDDIQISGLKLNNSFIALSLGLKKFKSYFYLVPSYKNKKELIRYSPGKILMIELIDYFYAKDFQYFDFCNGNEIYKKDWSNNKIDLFLYIKPTNLVGFVLNFFLKLRDTLNK